MPQAAYQHCLDIRFCLEEAEVVEVFDPAAHYESSVIAEGSCHFINLCEVHIAASHCR